jgi:hypothetical protein
VKIWNIYIQIQISFSRTLHVMQGENKWSLHFQKFIVKQSGKVMHPNLQMVDCNYQRFESKHVHAVTARGTTVKKMVTLLQKATCVLWFNETRFFKLVWWHFWMESGVDSPSKPLIYAFCKQFCETGCLCKGEAPISCTVYGCDWNTNLICVELPVVHIFNTSNWWNKLRQL